MFSTMDDDEEAHLSSCICDYHIYNAIGSATVGERVTVCKEVGNVKDRYVISILQGPDIVEH